MCAGFFGKLFKGEKKNIEVIETTLEYFPTLIEKNFSSKIEELTMETAKKISQIKYLHSKCLALIKDIQKKELEEKNNERFNKAALTSKTQLETRMVRLLEKLNPDNRGNTLEDARAYAGEAKALLLNEVMNFRKSIAYTSAYMKDEMKSLGETLQELVNNYHEISNSLDKEKELFEFEKTKEKVELIKHKENEISTIENTVSSNTDLIKDKEVKAKEQKQKIDTLSVGKEMSSLMGFEKEKGNLASQKQQLKIEISSMVSTIDKPLTRFKSLVDSGRWKISVEQRDILESFINNPMIALKKDPSATAIKDILKEIISAIEDEKIDLKDKEKEKRVGALNELITFDFFEKVFWRLNEIQKKQTEIDSEINNSPIQKLLEKEENNLKEILREKEDLEEKNSALEKQKKVLEEENKSEKMRIMAFAEKVTGKRVILKK